MYERSEEKCNFHLSNVWAYIFLKKRSLCRHMPMLLPLFVGWFFDTLINDRIWGPLKTLKPRAFCSLEETLIRFMGRGTQSDNFPTTSLTIFKPVGAIKFVFPQRLPFVGRKVSQLFFVHCFLSCSKQKIKTIPGALLY